MEPVDVEPVLGDLGPRTAPFCEEIPELLGVIDVARESTTHANDGNGGVGSHVY